MDQDLGRSVPDGLSCCASSQQAVSPVPASIPSAWVFRFEAPAGERVLRHGFFGISAGWGEPGEADCMYWDYDNRRWIHEDVFPWGKNNPERTFAYSSSAPCRSFAAFKRHLRKHGQALGQRKVRLVSRYVGHDVIAMPAQGMSAGTAETGTGSGQSPPARSEGCAQGGPDASGN